jgi:hypothetical protein
MQLAVEWIRKLPSPLLQQQHVMTSCSYIFKFQKPLSIETADSPLPPKKLSIYLPCIDAYFTLPLKYTQVISKQLL